MILRVKINQLLRRVDRNGECWIWTGPPTKGGYGQLRVNGGKGRRVLAHRLAYELFVGDPPPSLHHKCGNKLCVNPDHLEPMTHADHMRRHAEERTHCRRGHPYDEANTYITPEGKRQCRACKARWMREVYEK